MSEIKLLQGDCLELMKGLPDNSVDLVVTDPPYRLVKGGCTNKKEKDGIFCRENVTSGKLFKHNDLPFSAWLPEVYRVLKTGTHCYIFINGRNLKGLQVAAEDAGFQFVNLLVWKKQNKTTNRYYMNQLEFVLLLRKGRARTINNRGTSNLLEVQNIIGKKAHPTEKPVELVQIFVENSSQPGETVLDPFMGVGGVGVACVNTGRNFIGMELDQGYFDIASKRISEAHKKMEVTP